MNSKEINRELLRSYASGPRIWDAAAILPGVYALANQGLIEPAKGGSSYLYQLTRAGREALRQLEDRVFNVKIACVELIEAPDAASAVAKLGAALIAAGFSPLLDAGPEYASAFESEDS